MTILSEEGEQRPDTGIIPRPTVRDMVKRRAKAIDLFGEAHGAIAIAGEALERAKKAFRDIDQRGRDDRYVSFSREEEGHFLGGLKVPELDAFTASARKMIDRRMWAVIIELTDLQRLMDKKAKDQLQRDLQGEPPEATEENIFATLQTFLGDADMIFRRGVAECFTNLDRRFRSHDGWKIGSRVILTRSFDDTGNWNYRGNERDTITDIERAFIVLDNSKGQAGGAVYKIEEERRGQHRARQSLHETEYFRVRVFLNGNAHLWFKRDDLLAKVNRLLGEYYAHPIPEERAPEEDTGLHRPKTALAKGFGFYPTPAQACDYFMDMMPLHCPEDRAPLLVLEPSAGTGNLSRRCVKKGAVVDCIEYQPQLAEMLRHNRIYRDVRCGDFMKMKPDPNNLYDRVAMNPPFDLERDIDHVMHALEFLKPDGCLTAIMSAGTEFRETKKSKAFRDLMTKMKAESRDLPAGSFASSGTYCNTIMLRVWKDGRTQSRW